MPREPVSTFMTERNRLFSSVILRTNSSSTAGFTPAVLSCLLPAAPPSAPDLGPTTSTSCTIAAHVALIFLKCCMHRMCGSRCVALHWNAFFLARPSSVHGASSSRQRRARPTAILYRFFEACLSSQAT